MNETKIFTNKYTATFLFYRIFYRSIYIEVQTIENKTGERKLHFAKCSKPPLSFFSHFFPSRKIFKQQTNFLKRPKNLEQEETIVSRISPTLNTKINRYNEIVLFRIKIMARPKHFISKKRIVNRPHFFTTSFRLFLHLLRSHYHRFPRFPRTLSAMEFHFVHFNSSSPCQFSWRCSRASEKRDGF